jgi:uncharacterized protein with PIN domain
VETRFAVDRPLERLARWLRLLGRDASVRREMTGRDLLVLAAREDRLVLTRDARLARDPGRARVRVLAGADFRGQLRELAEAGLLDPALRRLARCTACNEAPCEVTVADLRAAQSARMPASAAAVTRCPRCRRVAWRGTQFDRIEAELTGLGIAGPGSFRCTTPSRPTGASAAGVSG